MPATGYSFPIPCTILVSAESDSSEPPESLRESRTSLLSRPERHGESARAQSRPRRVSFPRLHLGAAPTGAGGRGSRSAVDTLFERYRFWLRRWSRGRTAPRRQRRLQRHERHADLLQPGRDGEGLLLTPQGTPVLEGGLSMAMAAAGARGELVARGCERLRVGVQSRWVRLFFVGGRISLCGSEAGGNWIRHGVVREQRRGPVADGTCAVSDGWGCSAGTRALGGGSQYASMRRRPVAA